jgi:sulfur carrier protein ThiS
MIKVKFGLSDKGTELKFWEGMKVKDALRKLGYSPLFSAPLHKFVNGLLVGDDEELKDGDELIVVPMVSGG